MLERITEDEELVRALQICSEGGRCLECNYKERKCCYADMSKDAYNAIEELISRVPKWISVKEKLPDNQRPVLVYVPESEDFCEYVGMADYTWSPKGGFWCGTDGETYGAIGFIRTPTHWCELPEPPKGE